jgi:putative transposase
MKLLGKWQDIHYALYEKVRREAGRKPDPSLLIIDSQSVKTGKLAEPETKGYDGARPFCIRPQNSITVFVLFNKKLTILRHVETSLKQRAYHK